MSDQTGAYPRLSSPTLNAPDSRALATFYAALTGGAVTYADDDWAVMNGPNGRIDVQTVADYTPPTWPGDAQPVRMHLDFYVADLEPGVAHAVQCGATLAQHQPNAAHCIVMIDPIGYPFCLSTWDDVGAD